MMARTVKIHVQVDAWGEPCRLRCSLKGVNEPMDGGGAFGLHAFEEASAADAPPPQRLGWFARLVRWLYQLSAGRTERPAGAVAAPGVGVSRLSFTLRVKPGGPMGPMVD